MGLFKLICNAYFELTDYILNGHFNILKVLVPQIFSDLVFQKLIFWILYTYFVFIIVLGHQIRHIFQIPHGLHTSTQFCYVGVIMKILINYIDLENCSPMALLELLEHQQKGDQWLSHVDDEGSIVWGYCHYSIYWMQKYFLTVIGRQKMTPVHRNTSPIIITLLYTIKTRYLVITFWWSINWTQNIFFYFLINLCIWI